MGSLNDIYRKRWQRAREDYEIRGTRAFPHHPNKKIPRRDPLALLLKVVRFILKLSGLLRLGTKQARKINLSRNPVSSPKIGKDSFKVLHLSDLHLDEAEIDFDLLQWKIKEAHEYHFAVITGDLATGWPQSEQTVLKIEKLIGFLKPIHRTLFVLGNHDASACVKHLEDLGITVLTNQIYTHPATEFSYAIDFIGTDDPHYFFTEDAVKIMQEANDHHFKVALVHTPELYKDAQEQGVDLYLCGHTHAGQFALPGGFAPLKRVYSGKRFYKDSWTFKGMAGYTSAGLGTSTIEARFFTRAEITLHEISNMRSSKVDS